MKRKKVKKKQTGVRLEPEQIKAVKYLAVDTDRTFTSLVAEAVDDLLKKHQKKTK